MKTNKTKSSIKSTSTLIPQYIFKKVIVNKDTIKKFELDEQNRRMIRLGKVKGILKEMNSRIHFSSPFVVNDRLNKYFLIDGNHRYEAIKLKLAQEKDFEIAIWIAIYRNLSKKQEKEVYRLWNIGVTQTATDFLKLYFKTIPYGKEMLNELPVTIYGDNNHISIKLFVGSHICAKKQNTFTGGFGAGKEETISEFSDINMEDIEVMKEFYKFMMDVFGGYDRKNNCLFYKSSPLPVLYRLWFDNREIKSLIQIFKRVFASDINLWKGMCDTGSRNASILFYRTAIEKLKMYQRYKFKSDKDLVPIKNKEKEILSLIKN